MSTPTAPVERRHAFGWPPGSVRAILVLMVVALVCALLLLSHQRTGRQAIPIPPYLLYLLFLAVGYYFAGRGHAPRAPGVPPPLWLPAGSIRVIILAALTAVVVWRVITDQAALEDQMRASFREVQEQPLLPLVVLGGFFLGAIFRALLLGRSERSYWAQNVEAWFALIAVLAMALATLIELVINPTLENPLHLPNWESFLAGVVAFYFGVRS